MKSVRSSGYKNPKKTKTYKKYQAEVCDDKMTFQDCELAILRQAVDENEKLQGEKVANSDQIKKMIDILEDFLIRKKLICYGGTAINNILPKYAQFYNREIEVPDYDFYSAHALDDAIELSDIYAKAGYEDVEAKSGVHHGTYKVFVNFIPMADITNIHPELFKALAKEAVSVAGIKYAAPNFLRMNMYLELSRPAGDVSRWEKVLKRLTLLNTYHPMKIDYNCNTVDFQRKLDSHVEDSEKIYFTVRDAFIEMGVVFFGGYASSLYSRYMPKEQQHLVKKIPDFDVLYENPEKCAIIVKERLEAVGFKKVISLKHDAFDEIIPEHIEIRVDKEIVAFIYKPIACHNYNTIRIGNQEINVATIDTILNFYLAFMFSTAPYYYKDRILCMAQFLFNVEQENRLEQRGLLKRFSSKCYGNQETLESIRATKADKFKQLKDKKDSREFKEWFFKYNPLVKPDIKKNKNSDIPPINYENKKLHKKINKSKYRKTVKSTAFDKLAKIFT
jgi:hypothetical protein